MSRDELERFCEEAYPQLVAALTHQFGDRWLAEELAQDALIRACDHWAKVRELSSPAGWAFRVGVNLGNSWFRRRAAERRARERQGPDPGVHLDPDTPDRLVVAAALQQLTDRQREAVVLRYYLGLSAEQTAEVTDSTPGAVRGLIHRAVQNLRDNLDVHLETEGATDAS